MEGLPVRVLFAVPPSLGHLFPVIPLAWGFRTAGYDVLVASSDAAVEAAVRAGLPAVDVSPDANFAAVFGQSVGSPQDRAAELRARGKAMVAAGGRTPDLFLPRFARVSDLMADGTMRLARDWRPDLVVHSRLQGAGPLVARALGIPAVEHGFGFLRDTDFAERFLTHLAPVYRRHRVPLELPRMAVVHVGPPSLMMGAGAGWTMRYVPYNAGGLLPEWLIRGGSRRRVAVTLGTVVPRMAGLGGLAPLLGAAAQCDADFILALGAAVDDARDFGPLPGNIRLAGWVPLAQLLVTCEALVHHGGAGSTLTALSAGVPQVVLPHGADQFVNGAVITRHGLGLSCEPHEVSTEALSAVLDDPTVRANALATMAEIAAQPTPAATVEVLVRFVRAGL
jgi:UDP:flavonoid glycosyltransferase YjiC (YdhE family)